MNNLPRNRTLRTIGIAASALIAVGLGVPVAAFAAGAAPAHHDSHSSPVKPTIVLVHGAWADASSFAPITERLQHDGYTVVNAPNPLRNLTTDAAGVAAFVDQTITGPVVLVGHSYGGSVITDAALSISNKVDSLVYIDAYAPDKGESALQLTDALPGSVLNVTDSSTVFTAVTVPGAPAGDVDTYIKPSLFPSFFAAHLPARESKQIAASQAPAALDALTTGSSAPAWKTIPSFFFIGTRDVILPPAEQEVMAKRAHGTVVTGRADHLSMLEVPGTITDLIERAAR
jgi:pimeloyl-ACP methyl ester carboxylesterase